MSDLGRDEFLHLLITQLQNQDPMDPMDNGEFVAQLAQFASLQEMGAINRNLELLQLYSASINNSQAVNMIGKEVLVGGNELEVTEESTEVNLAFEILGPQADSVTLTITDEMGKVVFTQPLGTRREGNHTFTWHGLDSNGNRVEPGKYRFTITGTGPDGNVPIETRIRARVLGIVFDRGEVFLVIGKGRKIPLVDVVEIYEAPKADGSGERSIEDDSSKAIAEARLRLELLPTARWAPTGR